MFSFYKKLLIRQLRQGSIRLFCIAIAVACAVTFSISLLGDRLEQLFDMQAKEVLAADIVLQSSNELNEQQKEIIQSLSLLEAKTLTFQTMTNTDSADEFLLSSIKAVSKGYPLLGELQISNELYSETQSTKAIPRVGEAWVEDRVLNELNININQFINVGEKSLKVTRVLIYEPDRGNSFYSFTPRVLINWQDIAETQVVKPGSRVKYRYLFSGAESQINTLQEKLSTTLELNQKFITVDSANQALTITLEKAYRFLNVTALIAVLLGAVAAALVSFHYANEMTYQYALLRCLGLKSRQMIAAVSIPFVVFTLLALTVGFAIGGLTHVFILNALGELIPESLPTASIKPFVLSAITALIVVVSFASPFLYKLLHTAPKLLLNRLESQQHPMLLSVVFIMLGLSLLIYLSTQDLLISVYIIFTLLVFVLIAYFITKLSVNWLVKYSESRQTSIKLAARSLNANRRMVSVQIIAVALTFFSLALISTIRDDLIVSWQSKVPDNAPNIFAINLFEKDTSQFSGYLNDKNIEHSPLYPIVRGRLSAVNDIAIRDYANKESSRYDESLERDLALTWSEQLPNTNEIIQGKWHKLEELTNTVSVELGIAENLDIKLGDILTFAIQAQKISALVTSIRSVEWESFTPNFYMIFSSGSLDDLPATYMSSLHLNNEQRVMMRELVENYPSATFFDVDFLLNRIRQIADKVSYAVEAVLYFSLLSSILVFTSIEMILRKYRTYSTAIFKAVGADTKLIQRVYRAEFLLIGIISGVIAYVLNLIISFAITNYVIEGEFIFNYRTAILCLILAPLMVLIAGYISVHRTKQTPIKALLAES
ncbi:MAG: ABC transporter permease [Gammaproteobacteria bacterium]